MDGERASGNLLPGKSHVDGVRPLQHRDVGAPKNAIALVLQDDLHCVPSPVGVHDNDAYISSPGPWWNHKQRENSQKEKMDLLVNLLVNQCVEESSLVVVFF